MKKLVLSIVFSLIILTAFSENPFKELDFLIGGWQGVEAGVAGDGIGFRTYKYVFNKQYIQAENMSTFPISEKKPRGEVHRDFGIFSYNSNTQEIILREFHIEGFVNIHVLDTLQSTENKFVFITREIENNPGNWIARIIIEKISNEEFKEYFDIAMDGENYVPFLQNHWKKTE